MLKKKRKKKIMATPGKCKIKVAIVDVQLICFDSHYYCDSLEIKALENTSIQEIEAFRIQIN